MSDDEYEIVTRPDGLQIRVRKQSDDTPEAEVDELHDCGYEEGSFACRIRHVSLQTGAANMRAQTDEYHRKVRQVKTYGI